MKTHDEYCEMGDEWAREILRDYWIEQFQAILVEAPNDPAEAGLQVYIDKMKAATTFGTVLDVLYYDCSIGCNDMSMLVGCIEDAMEAQLKS